MQTDSQMGPNMNGSGYQLRVFVSMEIFGEQKFQGEKGIKVQARTYTYTN